MRQKDVFGEDMIKDIKPADIALSMVKYCESKGYKMTNRRLQVTMYYTHIYSLCKNKEGLFEEDFLTYRGGPVLKSINNKLKWLGTTENIDSKLFASIFGKDYRELKKEDERLVLGVLEATINKPCYELVDAIEKTDFYKRISNYSTEFNIKIKSSDILDYYNQFF